MRRSCRPRVEQLEDRCVPYGVAWPDARHLTLSFAPDGTSIDGTGSSLFQAFNQIAATKDWQLEILRALQTWAVQGNVNLGVVADGGQAFGATGAVQADSRFGDIRIGAWPVSADGLLAAANPFVWTGTTYAGDLVFNTNTPGLGIGESANYDLFTIALHEAGHIFGLKHSDDPASVLSERYNGRKTGLAAADVAAFREIYAPRSGDAFELLLGNNSFLTAAPLGNLTSTIYREADITTLNDVDYYQVLMPTTRLTSFTVDVKTAGSSLLTPTVTVYDVFRRVVQTKSSTDPLNGNLTIQVNNPLGVIYYVKVENSRSDVFGIGGYQLELSPLSGGGGPESPYIDDHHTNDSWLTATPLPSLSNLVDKRFDAIYKGTISDSGDRDFYRLVPPLLTVGSMQVVTMIVWSPELDGLRPAIHVYDTLGTPIASTVLANADGTFTVQLPEALPNVNYLVEVSALDPSGANGTGKYVLGVDVSKTSQVSLKKMGSNTLHPDFVTDTGTLTLNSAKLYNFRLATSSSSSDMYVQMQVFNSMGQVVLTLDSHAGQPATTASAYLKEGTYTIKLTAKSKSGGPIVPIKYFLDGVVLNDPVGPYYTSGSGSGDGSGSGGSGSDDGSGYSGSQTSTTTYDTPYYF